jgi:hypothetical protein
MGWATSYIEQLRNGQTVSFRPRGESMTPMIRSGQLCTVEPIKNKNVVLVGDIVLCKVNGSEYLHLVKACHAGSFQIGNNHGRVNGWTTAVFGRLIKVE